MVSYQVLTSKLPKLELKMSLLGILGGGPIRSKYIIFQLKNSTTCQHNTGKKRKKMEICKSLGTDDAPIISALQVRTPKLKMRMAY